ncbi:MAG: hypothetical protein IJ543_05990 [Bacteroidales bacterium]|nr:hypothetical protein [Bacteroidales bacterium]
MNENLNPQQVNGPQDPPPAPRPPRPPKPEAPAQPPVPPVQPRQPQQGYQQQTAPATMAAQPQQQVYQQPQQPQQAYQQQYQQQYQQPQYFQQAYQPVQPQPAVAKEHKGTAAFIYILLIFLFEAAGWVFTLTGMFVTMPVVIGVMKIVESLLILFVPFAIKNKGLKVFALILAILLAISGILGSLSWFGLYIF